MFPLKHTTVKLPLKTQLFNIKKKSGDRKSEYANLAGIILIEQDGSGVAPQPVGSRGRPAWG